MELYPGTPSSPKQALLIDLWPKRQIRYSGIFPAGPKVGTVLYAFELQKEAYVHVLGAEPLELPPRGSKYPIFEVSGSKKLCPDCFSESDISDAG